MTEYTTNPNKRCAHCNGREVITIEDDGSASTNLLVVAGNFYCIDTEECSRNIEAENTTIDFYDGKIEIKKFGQTFMEVEDAKWKHDTNEETL